MRKKTLLLLLIFTIGGGVLFTSYSSRLYQEWTPILMTIENFEKAIQLIEPESIEATHQIHVNGNYIYIVKQYQGLHIIENSDPQNPVNKSFLYIPGCTNISSKGNYLYVDSATDLITLDLSNPENPEVSRERNIFPELLSPNGYISHRFSSSQRPANTVIVGWE